MKLEIVGFYFERHSLVSMVSVYEVPVIRKHRTREVQNAIHVSISRVMTLRILMEDKFFEQSEKNQQICGENFTS